MYRESSYGSDFFVPIQYDEKKCIGCNRCVDICQVDVLLPSEKKGESPIVAFPGECWYCGSCVVACTSDAIRLVHPLMNQVRWVEKDELTGSKKQ